MPYTEQQREIATIKPRTITLNLSEADCERISQKAGKAGLTVSELLQSFIGDLVNGTYSNGSDERDLASNWYERCSYCTPPDNTFLCFVLEQLIDPEDIVNLISNIEDAKDDLEHYEKEPEKYDKEEISFVHDDIECWEQELSEYYSEYVEWCGKEAPQQKEDAFSSIIKWKCDLDKLKGECAE